MPFAYRANVGERTSVWIRWWPLAAQEFGVLFATRWGVVAFLACLLPGLARLVMLLIVYEVVQFAPGFRSRVQRGRGELSRIDPEQVEFYLDIVLSTMPGMVFTLLLTSLVAARAIARDRGTNALELYFTRGISPRAYLFGKWSGATMLVGVTTVAVPATLWCTAVLLADDWTLLTRMGPTIARALAGLVLITCLWTAMCVHLSALFRRANGASVAWCMLIMGSHAMGVVLSQALREPWLRGCLCVWEASGTVVRWIAGLPQRDVSVLGSMVVLGGLGLGLWWLARRRLFVTEAVA